MQKSGRVGGEGWATAIGCRRSDLFIFILMRFSFSHQRVRQKNKPSPSGTGYCRSENLLKATAFHIRLRPRDTCETTLLSEEQVGDSLLRTSAPDDKSTLPQRMKNFKAKSLHKRPDQRNHPAFRRTTKPRMQSPAPNKTQLAGSGTIA